MLCGCGQRIAAAASAAAANESATVLSLNLERKLGDVTSAGWLRDIKRISVMNPM
jgi:hypothetical protein